MFCITFLQRFSTFKSSVFPLSACMTLWGRDLVPASFSRSPGCAPTALAPWPVAALVCTPPDAPSTSTSVSSRGGPCLPLGRIAVLHLPQRTVGGGVLAAPAARPDPQFWQRAGPGSPSACVPPASRPQLCEWVAWRHGQPQWCRAACPAGGAAASCPEPSRLLFPGRGVAGTAQLGPFPTSSRAQPPASRFLPGRSRSVRPPPSSSASGAHVACGSPAGPRSAPRGHHPPDLQAPRPGPRVSSSSWLICWDAGRTRPFSAQGLLPLREPAGGREPGSPAGAEPRPSTASPLPAAPDALGLFLRGTGARAYEAAGSTPRGGARLGMPQLQPPLPGPLAVHTAGAESPGGRFRAQGLGCRHVTCGGVLGTGEGGLS